MENDRKDGPPPQPTTKELPKDEITSALLRDLAKNVREGFAHVNATLDTLVEDAKITNQRLGLVERRQDDFDSRLVRNSERARGSSEIDKAQAAQLAQERSAREELAKKVDTLEAKATNLEAKAATLETKTDAQTVILKKVDTALDSPTVKRIGQSLAGFVLVAILAATAWLNARMSNVQTKVEERAPAPTVTVVPLFLSPDAGGPNARP